MIYIILSTSIFSNIKVLRSQLPLKNKFYPDTPADESIELKPIEALCRLCNVCGLKAPMVCGKCRKNSYCGQTHQKLDWKYHKKVCNTGNVHQQLTEILFPEFEIVIEREEKTEATASDEDEQKHLKEYEDMLRNGKLQNMDKFDERDLLDMAESTEDKLFGKFKKIIESNQTQVVRYSRHGQPLWISSYGTLKNKVPNCPHCNGKRIFEFQIMPQMLNILKSDDLDWGIIAIYTCEKDCNTYGKYVQEFCYKQDLSHGASEDAAPSIEMKKMHIDDNLENSSSSHIKPSLSHLQDKKQDKDRNVTKKKFSFQESDNWE